MSKPTALEERDNQNGRLFSPSAGRNLDPIMEAFEVFGLTKGQVIEFGAGTGEHASNLVAKHSDLKWLATERDPDALRSCQAWSEHFEHGERMEVKSFDLLASDQGSETPDADIIYSSNVIHIAPIEVLDGLLSVASKSLHSGGRLVLYGPFRRDGVHNSDGNANFDVSLKSRDASWGVRDLEQDVVPKATKLGFELRHVRDMPANNYFVVFERV